MLLSMQPPRTLRKQQDALLSSFSMDVSIQEAMQTGDLEKMKQVAKQAESWLSNSEVVSTTLNALKEQIKRLEN